VGSGAAGWNYAMWDQLQQRGDAFNGAFAWTLQRIRAATGLGSVARDVAAALNRVDPRLTFTFRPLVGDCK
jgi:hypothetical protein